MKFSAVFAPLALFASVVSAAQLSVAYDRAYDNPSGSMNSVACSDGENGLAAKYPTFGSVPAYVGASSAVAGWNSPQCGTCWQITYTNSKGKKQTVFAVAVDSTSAQGNRFNLGFNAMNKLTGGQAESLGRINAEVKRVSSSACGM